MEFLKIGIISVLLYALSGCNVLSPQKPEEISKYTLNSRMGGYGVHPKHKTSRVLMVAMPKAPPEYNNKALHYVPRDFQLAAYAKNRWVAPPAQMLRPVLVKALQDSHAFSAVVAAPFVGEVDRRLETTIISMQQDFRYHPSHVYVSLHADLINTHTHKVIASRRFMSEVVAPEDTPYGGVVATNQALENIIPGVIRFCAHVIPAKAGIHIPGN